MQDKTPSFHSILIVSTYPYNSFIVTAFGFNTSYFTALYFYGLVSFNVLSAFANIFQTVDFPDNVYPTSILPCLVYLVSYNYIIFYIKTSCYYKSAFFNSSSIASYNIVLIFSYKSISGNKSLKSALNNAISSATNFGIFISIIAVINNKVS